MISGSIGEKDLKEKLGSLADISALNKNSC